VAEEGESMKRALVFGLIFGAIFFQVCLSFAVSDNDFIRFEKDQANQGSAFAAFQLGYAYQNGKGVKQDPIEAAYWYQKGTEKGDLQAALQLADMYRNGEGVQKNEQKAIDLYVKVGKGEGEVAAIGRLNLLLLARDYSIGGEGVKPNKNKARALFSRLFEIEQAIMNRGQAQMEQSANKALEDTNKLEKMLKDK
jgi:TPR repeat protein